MHDAHYKALSEETPPESIGDPFPPKPRTDNDERAKLDGFERGRNDGLDPGIRVPTGAPAPLPKALSRLLVATGKRLATLTIVIVAVLVAIVTWQSYVLGPWTRNGSVRVQVANIAPQVSGQIVELHVRDNQYVKRGDLLYVIDPYDFEVALQVSKAQVTQAAADLELKDVESKRRQSLSNLVVSKEEQQIYAASAAAAKAVFDASQQRQAKAEQDLKRTRIVSPVTGYVTNLLLRLGDFAVAGNSNISVIDSESFWIDGYFEETKMSRICINDRVEARLMGYSAPITGRVETVTRGISVSNATAGVQGLPNVDPIYTWVRLAQRVPVRIAIDEVPAGVPLVSGMTATVTVRQPDDDGSSPLLDRLYANVAGSLSSLIDGPPPSRPDCLPVATSQTAPSETLPIPTEPPKESPRQIAPGIAPGLNASPKVAE